MSDIALILSKTDIVLSAFLAMAFTAAPYYIRLGFCMLNLEFVVTSVSLFSAFLICNIGLRLILVGYFTTFQKQYRHLVLFEKLKNLLDDKNALYKVALIIFLFWLPVLIALYPGTLINDTWGQLQQFILWSEADGNTKGFLNDHHPVFATFFIGVLIVPVAKLTGNWHLSIFIYVILQACLTCLTFSYSVVYLRKKLRLDEICTAFILLLYCIIPIYATSVQTVSKDALFSWIYVLFFVSFIDIVKTNGDVLDNKKLFYCIIITSIFCALTKKVGMYIIVFSFASLLLFHLNNRRKIVFVMLTVVVLMAGIIPIARRTAGIAAGGVQEMFSIPFQQTARYVKLHPQDITSLEKIAINKVLEFDSLAKKYNPLNADPVKQYHQRGRTIEYIKYLNVWASQLLRHPLTYLDALNAMLSGWFSFSEFDPQMDMRWHSQLDKSIIPGWVPFRTGFANITANVIQNAYHNLYHTPLWAVVLSYGFYAALLPAFVLSTTLRTWSEIHTNKYFLVTVPMILSLVLGCWLAPLSIHFEGRRYLYPLTYTMPVLLAWCMYIYQRELSEKS